MKKIYEIMLPFDDGGRYHIETSPLIWDVNQWTGFYMITASVTKGLKTIFSGILKCDLLILKTVPSGYCMFKVNSRNTRKRCEISSKLIIKSVFC